MISVGKIECLYNHIFILATFVMSGETSLPHYFLFGSQWDDAALATGFSFTAWPIGWSRDKDAIIQKLAQIIPSDRVQLFQSGIGTQFEQDLCIWVAGDEHNRIYIHFVVV